MEIAEIEEKVGAIEAGPGPDFLYALLAAYGLPKTSISRLRSGTYDKSAGDDEVLWKDKVYFRFAQVSDDELLGLIDEAAKDEAISKLRPRFLIVRNERQILARDQRNESTLKVAPSALGENFAFFLPWAGIEKTQLENLNYADVKAAEKMARLYDEIVRNPENDFSDDDAVHALNVFFSRLLFCFFAEDTGVFESGSFTNAIGSLTRESGEDTSAFLHRLFEILDTKPEDREGVPEHLRGFGYVNGTLFARRIPPPAFTAKARRLILECATLDWSQINPDIFGSMMQAVVRRDERQKLGMHYTSVENIMKVVRPLFLDDLEEAFAAADTVEKLDRLLVRIAKIQVFDPACGSGNFLVISYKELRSLEHRILERIIELDASRRGLFSISVIKLENFFGIEIEDFPHEIAILSLWLAKHQLNVEFKELFGAEIPLIPLRTSGRIVCANAARMDWADVVPGGDGAEVYVLGNPPYGGGTKQSEEQKEDLTLAFADAKINKYLDYVSIWLYKGAQFVASRGAEAGFVATNSISQGNHVSLLWPHLLASGVEVSFAHGPFRWTNAARGGAGVTCVVVGLSAAGESKRKRFDSDGRTQYVENINAYLVPNGPNVIVHQRKEPPAGLPPMLFGSMARDGGHLIMDPSEADALVRDYPDAAEFVRRFGGAREALSGEWRRCLWISDDRVDEAMQIPPIATRVEQVRAVRAGSKATSTRALADAPHRFAQRAHKDTPAMIVPRVSSERRPYIPMDFVGPETIISDLACAVYDAEPWLFGLLESRMHMCWAAAVAGRMESRYRYTAGLVYNTFPLPELDESARAVLHLPSVGVLAAREQFPDLTLAELYDPEKMPQALAEAHRRLDGTVDQLYRERRFESDDERLQMLFAMYESPSPETNGTLASA